MPLVIKEGRKASKWALKAAGRASQAALRHSGVGRTDRNRQKQLFPFCGGTVKVKKEPP